MSISRQSKAKKHFAYRSSFHRFINPSLNKSSLYSSLYSEICRYHVDVFSYLFNHLKFDGYYKPSKSKNKALKFVTEDMKKI